MKNLIIALTLTLTLIVGTLPASAQTQQPQTTLSAAITSDSANVVRVTSTTGVTTAMVGLVDLEIFTVNTVNNATTLTVTRGTVGTVAATHANAAKVKFLAAGSVLGTVQVGPCTLGSGTARFQPVAVVLSRFEIFLQACRSSLWMATYVLPLTVNSVLDTP